jgi:hypothetical protein
LLELDDLKYKEAVAKNEARLQDLRASDPASYLAELKSAGDPRWQTELRNLDPKDYGSLVAERRQAEITALLDDLKSAVPRNDLDQVIYLYTKLVNLDPDNQEYKKKRDDALVTERQKKNIANVLAELKRVPSTDLDRMLLLYDRLTTLDPTNKEYRSKKDALAKQSAEAARKAKIAAEQAKRPSTATGKPFVVAIEASVSAGTRPTVTGTTNLPDGTNLWISIRKPWLPNGKERLAVGLNPCEPDCIPFEAGNGMVAVKNGRFSDGPITDEGGAAISPGNYVLEITIFGASDLNQPPNVLDIIGHRGENMTGPLVGGCCFAIEQDLHWTQAMIQSQMESNRRLAEVAGGANIYYARWVTIGANLDRGH